MAHGLWFLAKMVWSGTAAALMAGLIGHAALSLWAEPVPWLIRLAITIILAPVGFFAVVIAFAMAYFTACGLDPKPGSLRTGAITPEEATEAMADPPPSPLRSVPFSGESRPREPGW